MSDTLPGGARARRRLGDVIAWDELERSDSKRRSLLPFSEQKRPTLAVASALRAALSRAGRRSRREPRNVRISGLALARELSRGA